MTQNDADRRRGRGASVAASVALVVAVAASCGAAFATSFAYRASASRQESQSPQVALAHLAAVKAGRYLGVVTHNLVYFDKTIGIKANLFVKYLDFGTLPSENLIESIHGDGATVMLELLPETTKMSNIAAGRKSRYLTSLGRALAATKDKVLLSFGPEMDARTYPWGYGHVTPQTYVAAFRQVHDAIARTDPRVRFVWQVSHEYTQTEKPLSLLWPGGQYVNMVGIDGYFYFDTTTWRSMFGRVLTDVRHLTHDPVLISETAIGPRVPLGAGLTGAGQAQDMDMLWHGIEKNHLAGLVWFDHDQHDYPYHQDWRLQPGSLGLRLFHRDALGFVRG